jgi:hypothetical protein
VTALSSVPIGQSETGPRVGAPAIGLSDSLFGRTVPPPPQAGRARLRIPRTLGGWALLVSILVTLLVSFQPDRTYTYNDTYRYMTATERYLGHSDPAAISLALGYYCTDLARTTSGTNAAKNKIRTSCDSIWTAHGGLAPNKPQFNEIFNSRPGYPLLAAPFVALFGLSAGFAVLTVLITVAAGWAALILVRLAGAGPEAGLAAMLLTYVLPTGYWLQQFLTEGPTLILTFAVLAGAVLLRRGATKAGLAVSGIAYFCGFFVRYSTFSMLAGCLLLSAGLIAWLIPGGRNRRTGVLALVSGVAFLIQTALPPLLDWPGFKDSLTDTFTNHFTEPVPHDLYGKWLSLNWHYWIDIVRSYIYTPLLAVLLALGLYLLLRYRREFGLIVVAAALTGLGTAAAHPLTSQGDRLYFQAYLLAICGLPVLADLLRRGGTRAELSDGGLHGAVGEIPTR